jgi:hypothetical protein
VKFAEDIAKKTGAMIDAGAYEITYYEAEHDGKPPYTADVAIP